MLLFQSSGEFTVYVGQRKEQMFGIVDLLGVVERAELFKQLLRNQRCIPVEDLFQLNVLIGIVPDQFFR